VFFNHFTRLEGALNDSVLWQAWGRGVALFTYAGTAYFDIVIPVAVPDGNIMTYLIVQVKNYQDDQLGHGCLMKLIIPYRRLHPTFQKCLFIWDSLWPFAARRTQGSRLPRQTKMRLRCFNKETAYIWQKSTHLVISTVGLNFSLYPGVEPAGIRQILRDLQVETGIQQTSPYIKNMTTPKAYR
jgi:hypothetical protein